MTVANSSPDEAPTLFVPRCLDCGYDLSGLADGKCPECGLRFEHAQLFEHARLMKVRKVETRQRRARKIWELGLIASAIGFVMLLGGRWSGIIFSAEAFLVAIAGWSVVLLFWMFVVDRQWYLQAHRILGFAVPLVLVLVVVSATPHRWWSAPVTIGLVCVLCVGALRGSPLVSASFLLGFGALPLIGIGVLVWIHAATTIALGHGWTQIDKPTPNGWKPLLASEAMGIGRWITIAGVLIAVFIGFFARRALVRLRRLGREGTVGAGWWRQHL
jgi:hypothetical protein